MTRHHKGASFIDYELPDWIGGKPAAPSIPGEQAGKGKPRPVTTLAVGEEGGGGSTPGIVTTMALGEEGNSQG
ncbi:hypothetical protein [Hyalangium rubrum]|uniref:Uncharacterized protein n=1 Tax=Hyalangium rubrum TaxID=3103134 RepID=A0ABU5GZS4_9BACT|nr:hypothetical protein [Hyalangium sp. s54d21]MDY7226199.1 hypothetical protein [Hyalangium sp. s54d21]